MQHSTAHEHEPSGLGITFTFIAGCLLVATGLIVFVYGFFGLFQTVGRSTDVLFYIGPKEWAVIRVIGGIFLFAAGCNIFVGKYWARVVGIAIGLLAIIAGLVTMDAHPVWGLGLVVFNAFIVWALTFHGKDLSFA